MLSKCSRHMQVSEATIIKSCDFIHVDYILLLIKLGNFSVITSVTPSSGSTSGGTQIKLTGRFFNNTEKKLRVEVGGEPCTNLKLVSDSEITCSTPAQPAVQSYYTGKYCKSFNTYIIRLSLYTGKYRRSYNTYIIRLSLYTGRYRKFCHTCFIRWSFYTGNLYHQVIIVYRY
jgi:hypothetical protein